MGAYSTYEDSMLAVAIYNCTPNSIASPIDGVQAITVSPEHLPLLIIRHSFSNSRLLFTVVCLFDWQVTNVKCKILDSPVAASVT
jgi:hypothetical protein